MSTMTCPSTSGRAPPGSRPAAALAWARAAAIPAIAVPGSRARSSTIRDIVGSEATIPNRCGRARSIATSAGQSPPAASITARSQTALPGWWTAFGRMNPPSSTSSASTRPRARAVSVSSSVHAPDTEPDDSERYLTCG